MTLGYSASHPLVKMHTLGNSFVPEGIHSGGFIAAWHPVIVELGLIEPRAEKQLGCFAAITFARAEGIPPAPEATMLPGAIDEALRCKEEESVNHHPFNLCGHGHFDMQAYMAYQTGLS